MHLGPFPVPAYAEACGEGRKPAAAVDTALLRRAPDSALSQRREDSRLVAGQ